MSEIVVSGWSKLFKNALKKRAEKTVGGGSVVVGNLATVNSELRPKVRAVVLRGFMGSVQPGSSSSGNGEGCDDLVFSTHLKTDKVGEIQHNKFCEVGFFFPETMEQFRIGGIASVLGIDKAASEVYFGNGKNDDSSTSVPSAAFLGIEDLNESSKIVGTENDILSITYEKHSNSLKRWFNGPVPGSKVSSSNNTVIETPNEGTSTSAVCQNYGLICLQADRVDYCDLSQKVHLRYIYTLDKKSNTWNIESVVP
ncbi:Pyridoxine/pyridoxamine 5'-phosphate oxidase 2 [Smittium culicis]|uniref:Pyridoxine/pyridoxamine 5'-phosphate oxidase 2 n=1 Tax=Smittium culicis TaxID=133412 RepID=A0A1R1XJM4_9FUNG|nr:Pyridoxine/pyridoxamine 5'-phosphate oxidase 2 [Smittium culicis]